MPGSPHSIQDWATIKLSDAMSQHLFYRIILILTDILNSVSLFHCLHKVIVLISYCDDFRPSFSDKRKRTEEKELFLSEAHMREIMAYSFLIKIKTK